MNSDAIWTHIDQQRMDLAEMLDGLSSQQWSTPSLCEGWSVREVAAHLSHSHIDYAKFAIAAVRSGFRFNATVYNLALADKKTPEQITAVLRAMVGSRRKPPGISPLNPLMDVLVHGQDIAVPLGVERPMPVDAAAAAADLAWRLGFPFHARRRLAGIRLTASDIEFDVGDGQEVSAPIRDILMLLVGRRVAISDEIAALVSAR